MRQLLAALGAELTVLHVMPETGPDAVPSLVVDSVVRAGLVIELSPLHIRTEVNAALPRAFCVWPGQQPTT